MRGHPDLGFYWLRLFDAHASLEDAAALSCGLSLEYRPKWTSEKEARFARRLAELRVATEAVPGVRRRVGGQRVIDAATLLTYAEENGLASAWKWPPSCSQLPPGGFPKSNVGWNEVDTVTIDEAALLLEGVDPNTRPTMAPIYGAIFLGASILKQRIRARIDPKRPVEAKISAAEVRSALDEAHVQSSWPSSGGEAWPRHPRLAALIEADDHFIRERVRPRREDVAQYLRDHFEDVLGKDAIAHGAMLLSRRGRGETGES